MIELAPRPDLAALVAAYAVHRRLQIRDVLTDASAERVFDSLANRTEWGLVFNQGASVVQLSAAQLAGLDPATQQRIAAGIQDGARTGYQFVYQHYPLLTAYFSRTVPRHPLFEVFEFVNSPAFLDLGRRLTGIATIRWADAHATLYRAGHFLKYHTDETPAERRVAAYVLNFTKGWGRDWGGYLQFFDERYDVAHAYRPVFNALNIFTVPADHSVGMVASYAPGDRLSVAGWFREDEPPGPIAV